MNPRYLIAALLGLSLTSTECVYGASAQALCQQTVIAALSMEKTSDLNFGVAMQDAPALEIAPGTNETADNASFAVHGEANRSVTILLPLDGTVKMTTAAGQNPNEVIPVNRFRSFPESTANLDSSGTLSVFVGATRTKLSEDQKVGTYQGSFTMSVVY